MHSNNQSLITIILMSIFIITFLAALFLFISSIISRREINKIELPSLEEIIPVEENYNSSNTTNNDGGGGFYFEDEDNTAPAGLIHLNDYNGEEVSSGATRSDYKRSKKKNFSIKSRKNS